MEEGWVNGSVPEEIARTYLVNMQKSEVDSVILGCTHYPLLKRTIKKVLGGRVNLVDSAEETAMEVKSILNKSELYSNVGEEGQVLCHVTDSINSFEFLASEKLALKIKKMNKKQIPFIILRPFQKVLVRTTFFLNHKTFFYQDERYEQ